MNDFEGHFLMWVDNILTKLDNYSEIGSEGVVLSNENFDVNVGKVKEEFI